MTDFPIIKCNARVFIDNNRHNYIREQPDFELTMCSPILLISSLISASTISSHEMAFFVFLMTLWTKFFCFVCMMDPPIVVKGKAKRVLAMTFWIEGEEKALRSTSQTIWTKISANV